MSNKSGEKVAVILLLQGGLLCKGVSPKIASSGSKIFKNKLMFLTKVSGRDVEMSILPLCTQPRFVKTIQILAPNFPSSWLLLNFLCLLKICLPTFPDFLGYFLFPEVSSCPFSQESISPFSVLLHSLILILFSSTKA